MGGARSEDTVTTLSLCGVLCQTDTSVRHPTWTAQAAASCCLSKSLSKVKTDVLGEARHGKRGGENCEHLKGCKLWWAFCGTWSQVHKTFVGVIWQLQNSICCATRHCRSLHRRPGVVASACAAKACPACLIFLHELRQLHWNMWRVTPSLSSVRLLVFLTPWMCFSGFGTHQAPTLYLFILLIRFTFSRSQDWASTQDLQEVGTELSRIQKQDYRTFHSMKSLWRLLSFGPWLRRTWKADWVRHSFSTPHFGHAATARVFCQGGHWKLRSESTPPRLVQLFA